MDTSDGAPWRGFHHVAVVTRDLEETVRFCGDVLGIERGGPGRERRQGQREPPPLYRAGGSEGWGLHFFESPGAEPNVLAGGTDHEVLIGTTGVQHVAFALPDEEAGLALLERLRSRGIETTGVGGAGPINNTLFFDNNGLLLEAAWPKP